MVHLGAIRLGGFGTLLVIPLADRVGRRRIFLLSLLAMSLGTCLTAFVQDPLQFAAVQIGTRAFMLASAALAVVILVEEFPAHQRGSAIGLLSLLGGLGYGMGALLYAVIDYLPFGWRFLYAAGALPILLLPFFRRTLEETRRFQRHVAGADRAWIDALRTWLHPFVELTRTHPRRALAVALAGFFGSMGSIVVFQYTSPFVQDVHGWAPGQYSGLVFGAGLIGLFGSVIGGRGSDRFGRRRIGFLGMAIAPLFAALFFNGPVIALVPAWGFYVLCMAAGDVVVRALAAELFPTSHRGTTGGVLIAVQSMGFGTGLLVTAFVADVDAELAGAVSWIAAASVVAALSLLFLPETRQRELEAISGEGGEGGER
jgi:MFS family permease